MNEPDYPHEGYCNASRRIPIGGDACSCRAGREIKRLRALLKSVQRIIERDFPNGKLAIDIRAVLSPPLAEGEASGQMGDR